MIIMICILFSNFLLTLFFQYVQKLWATDCGAAGYWERSRHGREGEGHEEEDKNGDDAHLAK